MSNLAGEPGMVYVDIDSMLDSRLGTLARFWPETFKKCIHDIDYFMRDRDDFTKWGGPTQAEFLEKYKERDVETLMHSIVTAVPALVKLKMRKMEEDFDQTPYFASIGMDVNVWPYEFQEDEIEELVNIMRVYGGLNTHPNIISKPPEDITPTLIAGRYKIVMLYDFRDWLAKHIPLKAFQMYKVEFLAPWLLPPDGVVTSPETLAEAGLRPDADVRLMTETGLIEYLSLEFVSAAFFSMVQEDLIADLMGIPEDEAKAAASETSAEPSEPTA